VIKLPNDNLVAIAYKAGYCGSLMYILLALSPEVAQYTPVKDLSFADGTAHEYTEQWFNNLHDYNDSLAVSEDQWNHYLTPEAIAALASTKTVAFRCHPTTAYKLGEFVENLRVLYMTHTDRYICERWYYEKRIKKHFDYFFKRSLEQIIKQPFNKTVTDQMRREILMRNFENVGTTVEECKDRFKNMLYQVQIDKLLAYDYSVYTGACEFLKITPIAETLFVDIIKKYNSNQWKRF
jgi:hypothetical protein